MSVSPEEPRPTLRQQIAEALEYETIENDCDWDKWSLADVVLGLEPIRRALEITACPVGGVDWCTTHLGVRNEDEELCDMADLDVADCVLHEMFYDAGRAVGVVDPKPAEETK